MIQRRVTFSEKTQEYEDRRVFADVDSDSDHNDTSGEPPTGPVRTRIQWHRVLRALVVGTLVYFTIQYFASDHHRPTAPGPLSTLSSTLSTLSSRLADFHSASESRGPVDIDWRQRQLAVREVFAQSWQAYTRDAWGYDIYHPIARRGENMGPAPLGWIIVDSLDTLLVMNLTAEAQRAIAWIDTTLDYNMDYEVNLFETTIRMLGGLLAGYHLTGGDPRLLAKAVDLGDRLVDGNVFDTPYGIPLASVNLGTGQGRESHADFGASSTAEVATLQLEFRYLSHLTGDAKYQNRADKVIQRLRDENLKRPDRSGLVPIFINVRTGQYQGQDIRLGSRGDSYYEYILKQYLQTNRTEPMFKDMYDEIIRGVQTHLLGRTAVSGDLYIGERPHDVSGELSNKMDHLVCFMGGLLALGATEGRSLSEAQNDGPFWTEAKSYQMTLAHDITQTCVKMYQSTLSGLAPEIAFFNDDNGTGKPICGVSVKDDHHRNNNKKPPLTLQQLRQFDQQCYAYDCLVDDLYIKPADAHNLQRPETVESLYVLWRITGDVRYREWGWEIFKRFRQWGEVRNQGQGPSGFTSLDDVKASPPRQRDNMESFWLAETLKYLYLLFEDDDRVDLTKVVFNTEAHMLPVLNSK